MIKVFFFFQFSIFPQITSNQNDNTELTECGNLPSEAAFDRKWLKAWN